jgi:hypothetical protein
MMIAVGVKDEFRPGPHARAIAWIGDSIHGFQSFQEYCQAWLLLCGMDGEKFPRAVRGIRKMLPRWEKSGRAFDVAPELQSVSGFRARKYFANSGE